MAEPFYRRYAFPDWLRTHSLLVGRVAVALAQARIARGDDLDAEAVGLAALLHDIGRSPLVKGDLRQHNELSALIVAAEGLGHLSEMAKRHPVYAPLDPATTPRTMAEKVVNVADRRGGMTVIPIEERVAETFSRYPIGSAEAARCLAAARAMEAEVFAGLPFPPERLAEMVR